MGKITEQESEQIARAVEKEFPSDPALQQVHIARKTLALEAQHEGVGFLAYVKSLTNKAGRHHPPHER
jgi:hypothetical protein